MNRFNNEGFVKNAVWLDANSEPFYWEEMIDGARIATVSLYLISSIGLVEIVDSMREKLGFLPMAPTDLHPTDDVIDCDGWYNFYIELKENCYPSYVDHCIQADVVNSYSDDNECSYTIELDNDARMLVSRRLNEESLRKYGTGISGLLKDSRRLMEGV